MAPPSKRPPQGRKPSQGKRPPQRPPQARKPAPAQGKAAAASETAAESHTVAEERKAKRESARQERIAIARRKQRAKRQRQILIAGVVAVALVFLVVSNVKKSQGQKSAFKTAYEAAGCGSVETFPDLGRNHIPLTETFDKYNSNPPTSGPHYAEKVAGWGSYNTETPQTTLVHNLEHGGIIIHYKDQTPKQVDQIASFVDSYQDGVISNPNPKIDKPIVLTSWTHRQECKTFSPKAVAGYIDIYCNKGPEKLTTCAK
jgi:hypothetical protein